MTRCAIYIRKSREEAGKPSHRLTVQREQLPAHARAQGWAVEVYDDGHASAARGKAEDLIERGRLERDIRAGRVQVVLCIELSRLSRDDSLQDYVAWLHLCSQHRVKLATPSRTLDPAQHSDWMLLLMEGGFSSVEMRVLQARMREGRAEAFRAGKWLGGTPPPPYRYDKINGRLIVDPADLAQMRQLWLLAETHSARAIAKQLGLPEIAVRRSLADDRLLLCQALRPDPATGEMVPCDWEAVLTAEEADRIRAGRRTRKTNGERREAASLLSNLDGLLRCGYCGRTVKTWRNSRTRNDGSRLDYYGCQVKNDRDACTKSRFVPQVVLDEKVITHVFGTLDNITEIQAYWAAAQANQDSSAELAGLDAEERNNQQKRGRLIDAVAEGILSLGDVKRKLAELDASLAEVRTRRREIQNCTVIQPNWATLAIIRAEFSSLCLEDRRSLLRTTLTEIRLYSGYALLTYPFPRNAAGEYTARINLPPPQTGKKTRTKGT